MISCLKPTQGLSWPGGLCNSSKMSQVQEASLRVGATRSGLDCRQESWRQVDASLRQSATVDSPFLYPFCGCRAARRVASDSSTPDRHATVEAVVFDSSRGSTRVSRPVAQTESDSSDYRPRHTSHDPSWGVRGAVARLVRLVRLLSDSVG